MNDLGFTHTRFKANSEPRTWIEMQPDGTLSFFIKEKLNLRIDPAGDIWWKDHVVAGDDAFRWAMRDFATNFALFCGYRPK